MSQLIRLVYASQSNNPTSRGSVDPAIGSILSQSRRNNQKQEIGGVLYFGDGYFFQCLEGEAERVQALYNKISQDPRHVHCTVLSITPAQQRLFSDWSMKFVPTADDVQQLLQQHGYQRFTPFKFSEVFIEELISFFHYAQLTVQLDPDPASYQQQPAATKPESETGLWQKLSRRLRFG